MCCRYRLLVVRNEVPRLLRAVFWRHQIHRVWNKKSKKGCMIPDHWPLMIDKLRRELRDEEQNSEESGQDMIGPLWNHLKQHSLTIMGAMTLRRVGFAAVPLPEDTLAGIGCFCKVCDETCPCIGRSGHCGPQCHALPSRCALTRGNMRLDQRILTDAEKKVSLLQSVVYNIVVEISCLWFVAIRQDDVAIRQYDM